ncbi:MAG: DMT family transporter [Aliarcobacter sp.]|nr:DMT family transporter [Aliarcobacter sp.]
MKNKSLDIKLTFLTFLALFSLSSNPVLCRMAMVTNQIDAVSFTFFRILSGAIFLLLIYFYKTKKFDLNLRNNYLAPFMLFLYAITFSFSYENMEAGIGTLILFAVVQLTMIFMAFKHKESLTLQKVFGIVLAFAGLAYLLYPKEDFSLSFFHSFLMIISGVAWAFYTLLGKKSINAFSSTKDNFFKASLMALVFMIFYFNHLTFDSYTLFLAVFSGVVTSALGYIIWYMVLPKMDILTAGVLQLLSPVIAIILGILVLNEKLSIELFTSTFIILFGIFITLFKKKSK